MHWKCVSPGETAETEVLPILTASWGIREWKNSPAPENENFKRASFEEKRQKTENRPEKAFPLG